MRYIEPIPAPVSLEAVTIPEQHRKDGKEHPEMPFKDFVLKILVMHPDVGRVPVTTKAFLEIKDVLNTLPEKPTSLGLESDQWEVLNTLANTFQYGTDIKLDILPFIRAINSASTIAPKKD